MRVSTSFSREEAEMLDRILTILLQGGGFRDVAVILRRPAFGKLMQKIRSLKARSEMSSDLPPGVVPPTEEVPS